MVCACRQHPTIIIMVQGLCTHPAWDYTTQQLQWMILEHYLTNFPLTQNPWREERNNPRKQDRWFLLRMAVHSCFSLESKVRLFFGVLHHADHSVRHASGNIMGPPGFPQAQQLLDLRRGFLCYESAKLPTTCMCCLHPETRSPRIHLMGR